MVPLFDRKCPRPIFNKEKTGNEKVAIILPYSNPVIRGILLDNCLNSQASVFIVIGDKNGSNTDTTSTLMSRYLLSCKVPRENIIKSTVKDGCIDEALVLGEFVIGHNKFAVFIVCASSDMYSVLTHIKQKKRQGTLNHSGKLSYYCD
jgi:hypothetical protein